MMISEPRQMSRARNMRNSEIRTDRNIATPLY
jgi:hypothetical protein